MARLIGWRRSFRAALVLTTLLALPAPPAEAAKESSVASWVCDIDWRDGRREVKRLIRCAARRWEVPGGGPEKALDVARCESGFNPKAYSSGNAGVYQQAVKYWADRAETYGFADWSVYNGRANVIVSIRMAHRGGWGPWSCA